MAAPIATTGQPGAPIATGGKPQTVKTVKVKAHTRTVAPKPKAPAKKAGPLSGLTSGQRAYWQNKLPGASAKTILKARANQIQQHNPQAFGPNTNLSPIQANQQAQAAANLKFGPQVSALQQQASSIPGWYQAYQQQVAALQQQANVAYQGAATQIGNSQTQIAGQQQTNQQNALQAMGQDAASRGATVDPNLAASSSQFQAGLNALNQSDLSRLQGVNQSQQQYLGNLNQIQQAAGQQNLQKVKTQLAQVLSDRGDYTTQQKANIIANAQKYGLELGALGLNQQKATQTFKTNQTKLKIASQVANQTGRNQRAGIRVRQQSNAIRQQEAANNASIKRDSANMKRADFIAKYGITPEQANKGVKPIRSLKGTGAGGLTPTKIQSNQNTFQKARALLRQIESTPTGKNLTTQQKADFLSTKGIPHDLALGAVQVDVGGVTRKFANHIFQHFGVHIHVESPLPSLPPSTGRNTGERPT